MQKVITKTKQKTNNKQQNSREDMYIQYINILIYVNPNRILQINDKINNDIHICLYIFVKIKLNKLKSVYGSIFKASG